MPDASLVLFVAVVSWTDAALSKPQTGVGGAFRGAGAGAPLTAPLTAPVTPPPPLRARTAHLAPAIAIPPLPAPPGVRMPRVPHQEVSAFVSWAETALVNRFEHLEPSIVSRGNAAGRQTKGGIR